MSKVKEFLLMEEYEEEDVRYENYMSSLIMNSQEDYDETDEFGNLKA